jgi:hypothetical protein
MLFEPGIPPHRLELKVGAVCTIQRNLNTEKGLVKNARVIIRQLNRYSVKVAVVLRLGSTDADRQEYPCRRSTLNSTPTGQAGQSCASSSL